MAMATLTLEARTVPMAAPGAPMPVDGMNPTLKSLSPGKNATGASATVNLLQGNGGLFSQLAGGPSGASAGAPGSESQGALSQGLTSETLNGFLLRGAAGDGAKTVDFSAQLARFQSGSENPSMPNTAPGLQRGAEAREAMAPLKSYSTSIELPVQHAEWGEKIAGKLAWLTSQRMSAAEIHITPPDMGPLDVRVQVQNDQAHVTIHATNSAVRDQLELNGHRLRDMLQENGLNLDSFDVSSQAQGEGRDGTMSEDSQSGTGANPDLAGGDDQEAMTTGTLDLSLRGEVDTYA
jgi:flagellar hook-length control protein FliK